jgi:hypothetical protein
MATNIITAFNNHFFEFVEDVQNAFPNNADILITKNTFTTARKANPKMIVRIWKKYVVEKYRTEIENGNVNFFLEKDYSEDVSKYEYSEKL